MSVLDQLSVLNTFWFNLPHAWIAVLCPAALSVSWLLVAARRGRFGKSAGLAFVAGTALAVALSWWTDEPGSIGLHVFPAVIVLLPVLMLFRVPVTVTTAFAMTWGSVFVVDVVQSVVRYLSGVETVSFWWMMRGIGGAEWLDALVLYPVFAVLVVGGLKLAGFGRPAAAEATPAA